MHRSIDVEILGRPYPLRVQPENEALMRRIASFVDEKMRSARTNLPDRPDLTIAIVATLSIAEELFAERARSPISREDLNHALASLAAQLDSALVHEG
jgi:cell division protein ZapA (FtsZ GTPase activity inhibitor)